LDSPLQGRQTVIPLHSSTGCAWRWARSISGGRWSLLVPSLLGALLWICVSPSTSAGGIQVQRQCPSCQGCVPPSIATKACAVLAGYLQADSSGQIWPHYDRLTEFTGDAAFTGSTDATVVDMIKTCGARLSSDTLIVSVLFRELGRVNIEQGEGRWVFDSGPRWQLLGYRLVSRAGAWKILLDPLPFYHIGGGAAMREAPPQDLALLRSNLARAARSAGRLLEPSCP
jgi:hypothetical protein